MSQQSYHFRRKGEEIDLLLDKASTAIQEVKTINGVSIVGKGNIQVSAPADSELSDTSTNAIQNKVVSQALKGKVEKEDGKGLSTEDFTTQLKSKLNSLENYDDIEIKNQISSKVDKVEGKQLTTEDFTTPLKSKLEGLSNYDDTDIREAVENLTSQFNTLVSGDASKAIESFNEIIAFLNGIEDSEDLNSVIASIEQQIARKQNTISDLEQIREGAAKGATALQLIPSEYVTESELNTAISNAITNTLNTEV